MNAISLKPRRDDTLARLDSEQRAQLNTWLLSDLTYKQICERIAQPPPVGFSVETSGAALNRDFQRFIIPEQLAAALEVAEHLPDPQQSLATLLNQSAVTTALQPELTPAAFNILTRYYRVRSDQQLKLRLADQRDRQLQLNQQRLDHHRRVFEYNAARAAIIHAAQLLKIASNPSLDNEQKIWAARDHLFDPAPDSQPTPKPINQFIQ